MVSIEDSDMVVAPQGQIVTGDKLVTGNSDTKCDAVQIIEETSLSSNDVWKCAAVVCSENEKVGILSESETIPLHVNVETSDRCLLVAGVNLSDKWTEGALELQGKDSCISTAKSSEQENLARELQEDEWVASQDPARITPRIFLKIPRCLEDIAKEIWGMVRVGPSGVPSLVAVRINEARFENIPKTHSTLVMKRKYPALFKARLCVRGDQIRHINEFSTSAPTASRISSKLLLAVSRVFGWSISLLDIIQTFLQSDLLIPDKRLLIIHPDYIPCPWTGGVDLRGRNRRGRMLT